jgi:membrane-bound lytic murein transglycosylase A
MVAQDTGSAIVGPARADIYFGAGKEAGQVAGRVKNAASFTLLLPNSLDPVASGKTVPLPEDRPSEKIAKLFPQTDGGETAKETVPLPEARPPEASVPQAKPAADSKPEAAKARDADAAADTPLRRSRRHRP